MEAVFDLALGQIGEIEGGAGGAGEGDPHHLLGIGVLFGHDGLFDVFGKFIANSANSVADVLGSDIDVAVEFEFHGNAADLLSGFTSEDFNSRDIINFLFQGFGDIGFDEFGVGAWVDGDDGDDGGIDVGEFADGKAGESHNADDGDGQIRHGRGHGAPDAKLWKIHGAGVVSGSSLRPGERRRLPERATRSPARRPLRISTRPGMRRPVSMGTSSATPSASR